MKNTHKCERCGILIARSGKGRRAATYLRDLSAVSVATGGSQVTIAVSFPGSAALSLDGGHLIFGGSVSEINRRSQRCAVRKENRLLKWHKCFQKARQ